MVLYTKLNFTNRKKIEADIDSVTIDLKENNNLTYTDTPTVKQLN